MYVDRFHLVNKNKEGERTTSVSAIFLLVMEKYMMILTFENNETKDFNLNL